MGYAIFVLGAAGAGKTTFCRNFREHGKSRRHISLINLDPAQENGADYDLDLCDFITVGEIMDECDYGPNGALFYALQEMCENLEEMNLQDFEDEYLVFDCPGQIELFLHSDILQVCVNHVKRFSKVAIVYLMDSTSFLSNHKLIYTMLCATISVSRFYVPAINVVSKADLLDEDRLSQITNGEALFEDEFPDTDDGRLNSAIVEYISNNGMLDLVPVDWNVEDTVNVLFQMLDNILQVYDDEDLKVTD